jgi:hypothetical protein
MMKDILEEYKFEIYYIVFIYFSLVLLTIMSLQYGE